MMKTTQFFEVLDDVTRKGRWFVCAPEGSDGSAAGMEFIRGEEVVGAASYLARVRQVGEPLDFTFADFGIPIVRREIAVQLEALATNDVQRLPVVVEGERGEYDVLNIRSLVDCMDRKSSLITYWTEADGLPEMVGQYLSVLNPGIIADRTGGHHVFRMSGWVPPIIVDARAGEVLAGVSGIILQPMRVVE